MIKIDELLSDDGFLAECPSGVVVALSDAAARIAELEKREKHLEEMFQGWRDEAIKASAHIAELEVLLKDCADELEAHLDEDYKRRTGIILPEYRLKYERDMAPVVAARAALNGEIKREAAYPAPDAVP